MKPPFPMTEMMATDTDTAPLSIGFIVLSISWVSSNTVKTNKFQDKGQADKWLPQKSQYPSLSQWLDAEFWMQI